MQSHSWLRVLGCPFNLDTLFLSSLTQDPFLDPKAQLDFPADPWCTATICPITPRITEVKLFPSPLGTQLDNVH